MAWLWFCQWRLSALQISHGGGGPMAVRERKEGGTEGWVEGGGEKKGETA